MIHSGVFYCIHAFLFSYICIAIYNLHKYLVIYITVIKYVFSYIHNYMTVCMCVELKCIYTERSTDHVKWLEIVFNTFKVI